MINFDLIQPNMPIYCCLGGKFATVDHLEGAHIKVKKDQFGQHHYMPLSWVISTTNREVTISRTGNQAMREWSVTSPLSYSNNFGES